MAEIPFGHDGTPPDYTGTGTPPSGTPGSPPSPSATPELPSTKKDQSPPVVPLSWINEERVVAFVMYLWATQGPAQANAFWDIAKGPLERARLAKNQ